MHVHILARKIIRVGFDLSYLSINQLNNFKSMIKLVFIKRKLIKLDSNIRL